MKDETFGHKNGSNLTLNKRVNDIAVQKKKLCKIGESQNIATVESGAKDPGSWQLYMYICIRDID